jgi:prolyl-tRNA synthetase
MQRELFQKALDLREANTRFLDTYDEFRDAMRAEGGFVWAHWCGSADCEATVSAETKATIRTVPFDATDGIETPGAPPPEKGRCVHCGQESPRRVLWAKAY